MTQKYQLDESTMEEIDQTKRAEYIDQITYNFKNWDKHLEEFEHKVGREVDKVTDKYQSQINDLKKRRAKMENQLKKLRSSGNEALNR